MKKIKVLLSALAMVAAMAFVSCGGGAGDPTSAPAAGESAKLISCHGYDATLEFANPVAEGSGYTDLKYRPAGKTGTSEVVYSKDVTTINQTYAMFAPYDNPKYSIVVISPNVSYNNDKNNYIAPINRLISKEVSDIVLK